MQRLHSLFQQHNYLPIPGILPVNLPGMTDYEGLKATELKELLKERNIPSAGLTRKQQYIDALEAQDAEDPSNEAKAEEEPTSDENKADVMVNEDTTNDATANGDSNGNHDTSDAAPQPSDQADGLKRKRDSPTPADDEESSQKKLKSTDDDAGTKQSQDLEKDAPVPIESTADETIKPMAVSDDVMDITEQQDMKDSSIERTAEALEASADPMAIDSTSDVDNNGPPSTHPPTSALYIRNLLRPLQVPPFCEHLLDLATPANQSPDASLIDEIHLDTFKSHAFVLFSSPAAAIRARTGLHDRIWPEETQRKALWVDFVPPTQARAWIAEELEAGKSKRFEVVYSTDSTTGETTASLEEASQQQSNSNTAPAPSGAAAASSLPGPGMPNAPTGPRGDRSQAPASAPTAPQQSQSQSHAPRKPLHSTASLSHFPSTTAKPKIFFKPVSPELVEKRLEELDRETSRDWNGGRQKPFGSALDQLRRYTFEDGDVVVDGGVDFGGFGRDRGAGGGAGHGGGHGRRRGGGGGGRRR